MNAADMPPQVSTGQLQSIDPGTDTCAPGKFSAGLNFIKDDAGQKFLACGKSCNLKVAILSLRGDAQELKTTQFGVAWTTPSPYNCGCASTTIDNFTRSFTISREVDHTFFVFLKTAAPVGTEYQLTVTWVPKIAARHRRARS
jgi:hypothetical protein